MACCGGGSQLKALELGGLPFPGMLIREVPGCRGDWGRREKIQVHVGAVLTAKSGVVLDMALVALFGGGSRLKSLQLGELPFPGDVD